MKKTKWCPETQSPVWSGFILLCRLVVLDSNCWLCCLLKEPTLSKGMTKTWPTLLLVTSSKVNKMLSSSFSKTVRIWVSIQSHWDQDLGKDQNFIWGKSTYTVWKLMSSLWLNTSSFGELTIFQHYSCVPSQFCLLKFISSIESAYVFFDFFWPLYSHGQSLSLNILGKTWPLTFCYTSCNTFFAHRCSLCFHQECDCFVYLVIQSQNIEYQIWAGCWEYVFC